MDIFDRAAAHLPEKAQAFWHRSREALLYLLFGGGTTLISVLSYHLLYDRLGLGNTPAELVSWVLAVLFAYLTNRTWVFQAKARGAKGILREAASFFAGRLATGVLEVGLMALLVDALRLPGTPVKIAVTVIVILLNYFISKLFVFRGPAPRAAEPEEGAEGQEEETP